jgi:hypothetical protein
MRYLLIARGHEIQSVHGRAVQMALTATPLTSSSIPSRSLLATSPPCTVDSNHIIENLEDQSRDVQEFIGFEIINRK